MLHALALSALHAAALLPTDSMPNISANYSFPVFTLIIQIIGWVLGGCSLAVFAALGLAIAALSLKGFGNERVRTFAGSHILIIIVVAIALPSVSGIFLWANHQTLGF